MINEYGIVTPAYRVGQRVEEIEELGLCKVIRHLGTPPGSNICEYLVREFKHPHRLKIQDELHLTPPQGKNHDQRAIANADGQAHTRKRTERRGTS